MRFEVPFKYVASVIPPRCRKARDQWFDGKIKMTIREVTSEQAPVAFISHEEVWPSNDAKEKTVFDTEYRWFRKELWVRATRYRGEIVEELGPGKLWPELHDYSRYPEQREAIRDFANSVLSIDGKPWSVTPEPIHIYRTFGLSYRHGGAALVTETTLSKFKPHMPGRNPYQWNWRIDDRENAIAYATKMAREHHNAPDDVTITPDTEFTILIPEAIRFKPYVPRPKQPRQPKPRIPLPSREGRRSVELVV